MKSYVESLTIQTFGNLVFKWTRSDGLTMSLLQEISPVINGMAGRMRTSFELGFTRNGDFVLTELTPNKTVSVSIESIGDLVEQFRRNQIMELKAA